ncbi:MAG: hypothetical protein ACO3E1_12090 [Flavobacteriales bacterium]
MPKLRKVNPKKGCKSIATKVKFKIGGRKSNRSAQSLSNDELLSMLEKPPRARDRTKLEALAKRRGLLA